MLAALVRRSAPSRRSQDDGLATAIRDLFNGWSIETTAKQAARIPSFAAHVPAGSRVNVAFLPDDDAGTVVETVRRLHAEGMVPVPHVPARTMRSAAAFAGYVEALAGAGAREALVIGGGSTTPMGPFDRSMQLLETGLFERLGFTRIAVAGHPEGNNDIGEAGLREAIEAKNAFAARSGLDVVLMTQFTFDAVAVLRWERALRASGNRLPIRVGVAGPASIKSLMRFAALCGVNSSLSFLTRKGGKLLQMMATATPDGFVTDLARGLLDDPGARVEGVHFYPFGGFDKAAAFAASVASGHFELDRASDGFALNG